MIQIQDMKKLTELYLQGQSLRQIGVHFKVSAKTIERRLKLSGVTLRDKNQAAKEQNAWWQSNQYLKVKYVDEGLSTTDIGKLVNASSGAVHTWLTKLEIPTRPAGGAFKKGTKMSSKSPQRMSEAKKGKNTGADNPNWRGAKVSDDTRERSSYQAKIWRQVCLYRDNNACTICESTERLHVHHILEFKDFPDRRWDINNGKTVCVECHEKIHNRTFPDWVTGRETVEKTEPKFLEIESQRFFYIDQPVLMWLYESNSTATIGKMFGFNAETVRKKLMSLGISRLKGKSPIPDESVLRKVYAKNNLVDTGRHFNVGQTTVHKWLKYYGICRRPNGKKAK